MRTAAFTLYYAAGLPTRDSTNGFRLFSRRVLEQFSIETPEGWAFSLNCLLKPIGLAGKSAKCPHSGLNELLERVTSEYLSGFQFIFAGIFMRLQQRIWAKGISIKSGETAKGGGEN